MVSSFRHWDSATSSWSRALPRTRCRFTGMSVTVATRAISGCEDCIRQRRNWIDARLGVNGRAAGKRRIAALVSIRANEGREAANFARKNMKIGTVPILLVLILAAAPAAACRTNSDCRQPGTRCINAENPSAPIRFCGPWHTPDSKSFPTAVVGNGSQKPSKGKPNRAATGESCKTDGDCPIGKVCTRPKSNSAWRCVAR